MSDLEFSVFWDDDSTLWDTVYLGDDDLPGIARVTATHGRKLDVKSPPGSDGATITDKGYQPAKVEITLRMWEKEQLEVWYRIAPTLTYRREPPRRGASGAPTKREIENENGRLLARANENLARTVELNDSGLAADALEKELNAITSESQGSGGSRSRARQLTRHDFPISHPALDTIQVHRVYIEEVGVPTPSGTAGVFEVKIKAIESRAPRARATTSVRGGAGSERASFSTGIPVAFNAQAPSRAGGAAP